MSASLIWITASGFTYTCRDWNQIVVSTSADGKVLPTHVGIEKMEKNLTCLVKVLPTHVGIETRNNLYIYQ